MKQALKSNQTWCKRYTMKNFTQNIFLNIVIGVEYLNEKKGKSGCDNISFVVFELNSLEERST
jgi:hypothetical protein